MLYLFLGDRATFKKFNENIQKCSDIVYKWRPADICINQKKCQYSQESVFKISLMKTTTCSCKHEKHHKFNCGKSFCVAHKEACRQFYSNNGIKYLKNIQKCLN